MIVVETILVIVAAILHATAYFGLKARKPWGWIAAVIVAAAWFLAPHRHPPADPVDQVQHAPRVRNSLNATAFPAGWPI
ncbi:MAG: hypothetical protein ACYDA0_14980 [Candidatus Dormibacteraceae bacterium]